MTQDEERDCMAHMRLRAKRCWELMSEGERAILRFGMSPLWTIQSDLGGKAPGEGWYEVKGAEGNRLQALALYDEAKRQGKGLVV